MVVQTVLGGRVPNPALWPGSQHHHCPSVPPWLSAFRKHGVVGQAHSPVALRAKVRVTGSGWVLLLQKDGSSSPSSFIRVITLLRWDSHTVRSPS